MAQQAEVKLEPKDTAFLAFRWTCEKAFLDRKTRVFLIDHWSFCWVRACSSADREKKTACTQYKKQTRYIIIQYQVYAYIYMLYNTMYASTQWIYVCIFAKNWKSRLKALRLVQSAWQRCWAAFLALFFVEHAVVQGAVCLDEILPPDELHVDVLRGLLPAQAHRLRVRRAEEPPRLLPDRLG